MSKRDYIKLYWEHVDNYKLEKYDSSNFNEKIKTKFISHSFYYHDIVWTIPTLINKEVILSAINNKIYLSSQNSLRNFIKEEVSNCISNNENSLSNIEEYYKKDFFDSFRNIFANSIAFINELRSDVISYHLYGESYLLSFLHETMGREYGRHHYNEKDDDYLCHIELNPNPIRDTLIIRQYLILKLHFWLIEKNEIKVSPNKSITNYLLLSEKMLNFLAKDEKDNNISSKIIDEENWIPKEKNSKKNYYARMAYTSVMKDISTSLGRKVNLIYQYCMSDIPQDYTVLETSLFFHENTEKNINFLLWEERFKTISSNNFLPHKNILRQKMLENHKEIQELKPDFKPYSLEFKKNLLEENQSNDYIGFGLFDEINIKAKSIRLPIHTEIYNLFEPPSKKQTFTHKHALMHFFSNDNYDKTYIYDLYMLITLNSPMDIQSIVNIAKSCKKIKNNMSFYKSLGPQDLVLHFQCESRSKVWELLNKIREENQDSISRTYTIVASKEEAGLNEEEHDIKIMCTSNSMDSVSKIPSKLKPEIEKRCHNYKKLLEKIEINDTIGFRTYEVNFYDITLKQLIMIIEILKELDTTLHVEYYFIKNEPF